ncbi:MAG: hypothetical protein HC936_14570 [Leptolyngbyaceae cyanobacterium SU_3_3]|nr:hypothetical protein [Leptolyngbyaceae cyanobacterium SU_3_3]
MMTPKEELIQAIERSPDEVVQTLLGMLKVLQLQRSTATLMQSKTVLERMGGEPQYMLSVGGLSDRDRRRDLIAMRLQQKYGRDS